MTSLLLCAENRTIRESRSYRSSRQGKGNSSSHPIPESKYYKPKPKAKNLLGFGLSYDTMMHIRRKKYPQDRMCVTYFIIASMQHRRIPEFTFTVLLPASLTHLNRS